MKNKKYLLILVSLWTIAPFYSFISNSFADNASVAMTLLQSLTTLFVLNFAAYFLGWGFFSATRIDIGRCRLKRLYKTAAGFGIIFMSLAMLGLLHAYTHTVLNLYLALLVALSILGAFVFINDLPLVETENFTPAQVILLSLALFVILLDFFTALVPPVARDSIIHHLAIPKLYLKRGGIVPLDFMSYSFNSINLELLYMLAIFLKNDILARVIHFNFYILSTAALYNMLRYHFSKTAALVGMLVFASIPVVFNTASRAYVDLGMAFFGIMLLNAAIAFYRTDDTACLILGGMMSGLCASTKINGYLYILLVFVWIVIITQRKSYPTKKLLKAAGIFLLFAFIFDAHFLLKNAVHAGNPFHPVFSSFIGSGSGSAVEPNGLLPFEIRKLLYGHTWVDEITMPWALSTDVNSRALYTVDGALGPLFIVFLPFIFFVKKNRFETISLFCITAVYTALCSVLWIIRLRYLIILFPMCAFMLAAVIDDLFCDVKTAGNLRIFSNIIISVIIFLAMTMNMYHIFDYMSIKEPFAFLTGKLGREEYLAKHYDRYRLFKYINGAIAEKNALIYFLDFGNDGYYCDIDYIYDSTFLGETFKRIAKSSSGPDDILRRLSDMGITHLLVNRKYFNEDIDTNYGEEEQKTISEFMTRHTSEIKSVNDDVIYRLNM